MKTKPETFQQAQTWQSVLRHAVDAGLCHGCAAQLAWGSQNGFATVRPPCDSCQPIVARFEVQKPNQWRVPAGTLSRPSTWLGYRSDPPVSAGATEREG